jgi:hypothetical protein
VVNDALFPRVLLNVALGVIHDVDVGTLVVTVPGRLVVDDDATVELAPSVAGPCEAVKESSTTGGTPRVPFIVLLLADDDITAEPETAGPLDGAGVGVDVGRNTRSRVLFADCPLPVGLGDVAAGFEPAPALVPPIIARVLLV